MNLQTLSKLVLAYTLGSLLSTSPAMAIEPTEGEMLNHSSCIKGADTRDLEIIAKGTGLAVSYTKDEVTKEIGVCTRMKTKCQEVFDQIKSTLEKSGYVCKT